MPVPRIPIETPLTYLARRTFSDYQWLTAEGRSAGLRIGGKSPITPERQLEFDQWWARHSALPTDELMALVTTENQKESAERERMAEARERARFFHDKEARADFDYWSKMAHWSIDEAIALSLGRSPQIVNMKSVQPYLAPDLDRTPASPFAVEYARRMELAKRSVTWKQLFDPVLPSLFLAWSRRLELGVPAELTRAVEARGPWLADWKDMYDEMKVVCEGWQRTSQGQAAKIVGLTDALAQATSERDALSEQAKAPRKADLSTRERETLFKLVVGMAVRGYRYDPEAARNDAPGEIAGDLASLGIEVTDDTVRKWLKEAAATVLPKTPPKD